MDIEEESVPDAASACKRQKRTNSEEENCEIENETEFKPESGGDSILLVGKEAGETANNNNKGELKTTTNDDKNTKVAEKSTQEENVQEEEPQISLPINDVLTDDRKNEEPASTSSSNPPQPAGSATGSGLDVNYSVDVDDTGNVDTDDDSDNDAMNALSRIIPRPSAHRTRSYRSSLALESSSTSDSGSYESEVNSDTNDPDAELNAVNEAVAAINAEADESESEVSLLDDDSSGSNVAFWNRYYTSSNEDNDSDDYMEAETSPADKEKIDIAVNRVMTKSKPSYNWNFAQELMQRENNLLNRIGWRGGHTSALSFGQGYHGSRQAVESIKLAYALSHHRMCVNCLSFNRTGDLICSGSDDLLIIIWDWANNVPRHIFKSGHNLNIFQTKFVDSAGCLDIVSSSRDGMVRRAVIPPSGSNSIKPTRLYSHTDAVHKLVVVPNSRHEVMSAGEDAVVKHFDLRTNTCTKMLRCETSTGNRRVRLFSIAHHPFTSEFCVSGSDDKLRVYDTRKMTKPVHEMTPKDLKDTKTAQITCAVYNHCGSEILASYSETGIYLYDSRNYQEGEYLHSYEGHTNSRTIKGVNFFGSRSEFIVSGSDCGNIFYWDKNTEAVINFMRGDQAGVVNCLEQHPFMPVLATSGLDSNVKIWTPSVKPECEVPRPESLKDTLQRNFRRSIVDVGDFDINQIHHFIRQLIEPRRNPERPPDSAGNTPRVRNPELFNISSSSNSTNSNNTGSSSLFNDAAAAPQEQRRRGSSSDETNLDPLGCNQQ